MPTTRFRAANAASAVAMIVTLLSGCATAGTPAAGRLTPVRDRVTDEAIARDLALFDSYERRLGAAAPNATGAARYVAARASEYVRVARDAYERNDRTSFVEDALAWAAADIETLERNGADAALTSVVPIPVAAQPVDAALWARAEALRRSAGTLASPEDVARAEGQLLRAGHTFLAGPACVVEPATVAATRFLAEAEKGKADPRVGPPPSEVPIAPREEPRPTDPAATPTPACSTPDVLAGVPSIVHFALDRHALAPATRTVLDALVARLVEYPGIRVRLAGHTDVRASDAYNQALSERRVHAVRDYLRSKGVAADRIAVEAFGERDVLVPGDGRQDHARNRRVALTYIRCDGTEAQPIEQLNDLQLEAARRRAAAMKEKD
jgi:outer membrane protein OmpA-like peptidoglycan-associated protein